MSIWTLKNITSEQYDEIYAGTPAMDIKHLFETEPIDDQDALERFFPSRLWRINSGIYHIENKVGDLIPFEMNYAQHKVYAESLKHPRLLILKSRQQGISTFWLIYSLDMSIVEDHTKGGLMAQGLDESRQLKERLERAWDNIPSDLLDFLKVENIKRNNKEFALNNGSKIYIATSFRSGTLQFLHISEFGKISAKYPDRAKETKTGSLQAIKGGQPVIIESTAEGRNNMFYDMWNTAISHQGVLTPKDFKPVFLSWVDDPDCNLDIPQTITKEAEEYFDTLKYEYEKFTGKKLRLRNSQKWWWVAQLREFEGDLSSMGQEYPGYPEEAFSATKDGTYWAKLYRDEVVNKGHLVENLYDPALDVYVAIDLGMNDMMCLVFYQLYSDKELRIIDEYHNWGEGIKHYVDVMREREKRYGYKIKYVYLPHDANIKELGTGKSRLAIFRELGVNVRLIPKTKSVLNDIELVRRVIPKMWFDIRNTEYLQKAMENYSKEWDDRLGVFKDKPLHNEYSHPADAIRYMVISVYHKIKSPEKRVKEIVKKGKVKSNVVDGMAI